ncbi:MAG TPA: NADPH:quinone oxidoreductase family protein [Paracoccaceae bacterium]|nr:NADPH:quinone oxidoreductase family protein [Paracoccaceae bacterium]
MRAMIVPALDARLEPADLPPPEPGPGEVRLRVLACGVNFADTLLVKGRYQVRPEPPFAPGGEVCGVVEAAGEGVALTPGTRVAALVGHGGFAEQVLAPAAACAPVPDDMPSEEAAGFLVAYGTSHLALARRARLRAGETLLVLGAAGGVGLTAVEIGALLGATVVASARGADRLALAKEKGATHLIDSETEDLKTAAKALGGADVVYDPVGGDQFRAGLSALKFEGRILPIGFASGEIPQIPANIVLVKNVDVIGLNWPAYLRHAPEAMAESVAALLAWRAEGRLTPHVSNVLPLAEAEAALDLLRRRAAAGKVVLRVAPD